ncbi:MAG TPA: Wzz/FepE/Etk N-terminal domain-containing protein [Solirubrobacteraceae bacterium]|nr:Wzz/FepE/Etk N-terminal domain-containing protein [Solirubrobacteraceae bacterium]
MELNEIFKILRKRWIATGVVVALAVAATLAVRMSSHSVPTGVATAQILVDSPSSELANLNQDPTPLISRASVFAQVMTSNTVLAEIGKAAGVPADQLTASGPFSGSGEVLNTITPAEARSSQIVAEKAPYRLTFVAQQDEPVITATVQGPTELDAARVANAVYTGTRAYVDAAQREGHTPSEHKVTLRQLGPAEAGVVNHSSRTAMEIAALLGVLILGVLAIVGFEALRRRDRELAGVQHDLELELRRHSAQSW